MTDNNHFTHQQILFSCESAKKREGQQFVPEHVFGYILAGSLQVQGEEKRQTFEKGDTTFFKKNKLGKFSKHPPEQGGPFKSVNIILDQPILQQFSREYHLEPEGPYLGKSLFSLAPNVLFDHYFQSLLPYFDPANKMTEVLTSLKIKEGILLLLQTNPYLKDVLFDFKQPGKINLEEFMQQNYVYNVSLDRFARLAGRSLSAFKRDFEHIFNQTPHKWLQERRLQEAYYLMKEKGKKPSDIYLELGFEDFSHFSFTFRKRYGLAPSLI